MTPTKYLLKKFLSGERKAVSLVICALLLLVIFQLIRYQLRSGDRDMLFANETRIINRKVEQFLTLRHQAIKEGGGFLHDTYYLGHIAARLQAVAEHLAGDERQIMLARMELLKSVGEKLLAYESAIGPLRRSSILEIAARLSNGPQLSERGAELDRGLSALEELLTLGGNLKASYRRSLENREVTRWKIDREFEEKVKRGKGETELRYTGWLLTRELEDHWERYMYVRRQNLEIQRRMVSLRSERMSHSPFAQGEVAVGSSSASDLVDYRKLQDVYQRVVEREGELLEGFEGIFRRKRKIK